MSVSWVSDSNFHPVFTWAKPSMETWEPRVKFNLMLLSRKVQNKVVSFIKEVIE